MSEEISYREFRDGLADVLNRIEYRDESFTITRRGKPVAIIAPYREVPYEAEEGAASRSVPEAIADITNRVAQEERTNE